MFRLNRGSIVRALTTFTLVALLVPAGLALADDDERRRKGRRNFRANLDGFQEVPASIFTPANGHLVVRADKRDRAFHYSLELDDFPEGDTIFQVHLHFSRRGTNGGFFAFLCGTEPTPAPIPSGTPLCPAGEGGRVTGVIYEEDLIALEAQGLPADFDAVLEALRAGAVYANLHSSDFVPGEIRGQLY